MFLTIIAVVLFFAAIAGAIFLSMDASSEGRSAPKWPWVITAVLFLVMLGSFGLVQISAGHVGVVSSFGSVQEDELYPGLHFVTPIINNVTQVDTRVRAVRIEGYTAASKEQQDLFLNMTLNYHVIPDRASNIIQQLGTDFEQKIVTPRLLDIPKSVTDNYPTTIVLNSRDEIREKSIALLSAAIEPYGLVVDSINLENFGYSPEYNASIEQKQIEEQKVQTERQILAQQEIQAEQAVVRAEGEANARIAEARGEAEANRLLAESLSAPLLQWQAIQRLQDNINIALVPSDGGFILDMSQMQLDSEAPEATPAP